jgi:hypothetical protein
MAISAKTTTDAGTTGIKRLARLYRFALNELNGRDLQGFLVNQITAFDHAPSLTSAVRQSEDFLVVLIALHAGNGRRSFVPHSLEEWETHEREEDDGQHQQVQLRQVEDAE